MTKRQVSMVIDGKNQTWWVPGMTVQMLERCWREGWTKDPEPLVRFDVPESIQSLMRAAVTLRLMDAVELYCMGENHGRDWKHVVRRLVDAAYVTRHQDGGKLHSQIVTLAERVWCEVPETRGE